MGILSEIMAHQQESVTQIFSLTWFHVLEQRRLADVGNILPIYFYLLIHWLKRKYFLRNKWLIFRFWAYFGRCQVSPTLTLSLFGQYIHSGYAIFYVMDTLVWV